MFWVIVFPFSRLGRRRRNAEANGKWRKSRSKLIRRTVRLKLATWRQAKMLLLKTSPIRARKLLVSELSFANLHRGAGVRNRSKDPPKKLTCIVINRWKFFDPPPPLGNFYLPHVCKPLSLNCCILPYFCGFLLTYVCERRWTRLYGCKTSTILRQIVFYFRSGEDQLFLRQSVRRENDGNSAHLQEKVGLFCFKKWMRSRLIFEILGICVLFCCFCSEMSPMTEYGWRSEMLCMLGVPAMVTSRELLQFLAPVSDSVAQMRIIRQQTPNQYMVLIKFRDQVQSIIALIPDWGRGTKI